MSDREVLEPTATCREMIWFSARLQLPSFSRENVDCVTDEIISEFMLGDCSDTLCSRLSAGQKRRTTLGLEIIKRPFLAILDEPTSGLDSYSGQVVLKCLRRLANGGCAVLLSIHQPNKVMFESMDHVVVLYSGRTMIQCDVNSIQENFSKKGLPVPEDQNPADWMLMVSQVHSVCDLEERGFFTQSAGANVFETEIEKASKKEQRDKTEVVKGDRLEQQHGGSICLELKYLLRRGILKLHRDRKANIYRIAVAVAAGSILATVYHGVVDENIDSLEDFNSTVGVTFFLLFCGFITIPPVVHDFLDQYPLFHREYTSGHYSIWSYSIVQLLNEITVCVLQGGLTFVIAFWSIGFQGRAWYQLLVYVVNAFTLMSYTTSLTCFVRDKKFAREVSKHVKFPLLIWCGFYVSISKMPHWFQWPSWLMPLFYTTRLFLLEEFTYCGVPNGHDKYILDRAIGLDAIAKSNLRYSEQAVLTLLQTGIYEGPEAISEYGSLLHADSQYSNSVLLHSACPLKDLRMIVHEATPGMCDITVGTIIQGIWNPEIMGRDFVGYQSAYGYRVKYHPDLVNDKALVHEQVRKQ